MKNKLDIWTLVVIISSSVFLITNPLFAILIYLSFKFIKYEEKFYDHISRNRKLNKKNVTNLENLWPISKVSEEERLENLITNQSYKLMRTKSIEDVVILNKLESELEKFYKK